MKLNKVNYTYKDILDTSLKKEKLEFDKKILFALKLMISDKNKTLSLNNK